MTDDNPWMPWTKRRTNEEIVADALAALRKDLERIFRRKHP